MRHAIFTRDTFWLWFGGIWLAVGAPFLILGICLGIQQINADKRFLTEARTVEGMVLNKSIGSVGSGTKGRSSSPTYHVEYRFTDVNGHVVKGNAKVDMERWDRLQERGPVEVTYLADDPQSSRVEGQDTGLAGPIILGILGFIFTSLGGFAFFKGLSQLKRSRDSHTRNR